MTDLRPVRIAGVPIGDGCPVYWIAEIGGNYVDQLEAQRLVDAAVAAGCAAIKFQTFAAETITLRDNEFNLENTGRRNQYEMFRASEPDKEVQRWLVHYAASRGVPGFSSPAHLLDVEFLETLAVPAYKIGSDIATHLPLLREVAQTGKPVVLATGMCTLAEVEDAVTTLVKGGTRDLVLLHCVSSYPAHPEEVNLRVLATLREAFGFPVGLSDHCCGTEIALAAVALGAAAVERHVKHTANRNTGPDCVLSSDEHELAELVTAAERVRLALGDGQKIPSPAEMGNRQTNRVSICVLAPVRRGELLTAEYLDIRRPGNGVPAKEYTAIVGRRRAAMDIPAGVPLRPEHLAPEA